MSDTTHPPTWEEGVVEETCHPSHAREEWVAYIDDVYAAIAENINIEEMIASDEAEVIVQPEAVVVVARNDPIWYDDVVGAVSWEMDYDEAYAVVDAAYTAITMDACSRVGGDEKYPFGWSNAFALSHEDVDL
ncbi:hypothetical protein C440_04908 [Haloferax mucosum ATCC BAA-1512]|uniref:Uncharacterized protein n=1 Tax=Haloferax mucosum ATCC BAA-1512 TaxID=662479 RepID=M0ILX2_9EURY|nr:hypothetical protein [Haloferax mucosum]ELZ96459.1 hypothetical protein C440_04908 [Haloferax mucosum ATCC BAA-1512]